MKKIIWLLMLFLIVGNVIIAIPQTLAVEGDSSYNDGVISLNARNYDNAIQCFQNALKANPAHVKAYNSLGLALQEKGDLNNAILAFQQAIKVDPLYANAYYNLGLALKDTGNNLDAIETIQTFINFNPTDSEAVKAKWIANDLRDSITDKSEKTRKYYLGSWLISDLNYTDAVAPLQKAVELDPSDANVKYALSLALKGTGNYAAAIEQLNSAVQINPQNAMAYYEMGECYEKMGDTQAAGQAWQNFVNLAPYAPSAQSLKSRLASSQQRTQTAQQQNFLQNQLAQAGGTQYSTSQNSQTMTLPSQATNAIAQYQPPANSMPQYQPQNMVPQYTPMTSYGAGFSGPAMGTPASRAGKTRIAVLDFDYSAVRPWWSGNWDIGKGVASLLTGQIVRSSTYSVVERTALDQVLNEQKLSNSSLFDPTTAASIGKLLGVDALVMGNISQFGIESKQGGFGAAIPIIGTAAGLQGKKSLANVTFDMRIVSVDTGEILDVVTVTGKSKRRGILIDFGKGGNAGSIDFSSSNFQDSVLGEASLAAVQRATEIINTQYEKITRATIDSTSEDVGVVAYVGVQGIIINAGGNAGLKIGNRLFIERLSDVVRDPVSGNVIKALTSPIGELELFEIESTSATGRMLSGGSPQVGDLVKFRRDMNVVVPAAGASTSVTSEILYKKPKNK